MRKVKGRWEVRIRTGGFIKIVLHVRMGRISSPFLESSWIPHERIEHFLEEWERTGVLPILPFKDLYFTIEAPDWWWEELRGKLRKGIVRARKLRKRGG